MRTHFTNTDGNIVHLSTVYSIDADGVLIISLNKHREVIGILDINSDGKYLVGLTDEKSFVKR